MVYRYKRVAYLDTDVGQPEFTAPGFLSLTVVDKSVLGNLILIALTILAVCIPKTCFHNAVSVTYVFGLFFYFLESDWTVPCVKTPER